jgi:ATP-dependent DNA helicase RecQ
VRINAERFNTVEITEAGKGAMKSRIPITLTKPLTTTRLEREKRRELRVKTGEKSFDNELFERLRRLRRAIADAKGMPAFMVFSDATLQDMAAKKPQSLEEMLSVSGVGERKLEQYGELFWEEVVRIVV